MKVIVLFLLHVALRQYVYFTINKYLTASVLNCQKKDRGGAASPGRPLSVSLNILQVEYT